MSVATSPDLAGALESLAGHGAGLTVEANLRVTVDGTPLAVRAADDRILVQVPSVWAAAALGRAEGRRLAAVSTVLAKADLTVEVRSGDAVMAVLGAEADPGPVARALSLGAVEVSEAGIVAAALRLR